MSQEQTRTGRRRLVTTLLVFLVSFMVYRASPGRHSTGDTESTRRLPFALMNHGTANLSSDPFFEKQPSHYSVVRSRERILPAFPIGTSLAALPIAPFFATGPLTETRVDGFERSAAALIASLAVSLLFLALGRSFTWPNAIFGTAAFAFATSQFSTASQGLWPFTGEHLCLAAALFLLFPEPRGTSSSLGAGAFLAAAVLCRPTAILLFPAFLLPLARERRQLAAIAAGGVAGGLGVLLLQRVLLGSWMGQYFGTNASRNMWTFDLAGGFSGVLLSPSRGLLPFFPYILVAVALAFVARPADLRAWLVSASYGMAVPVLLAAGYSKWWGGDGLGPRLLTETALFVALFCTITMASLKVKWQRSLLVSFAVFSIITQGLLVYRDIGMKWNEAFEPDANPDRLSSWRDSQLAAVWLPEWKPSAALASLGREDPGLAGSVDSPAPGQAAQGELVIRGWARINGEDLGVQARINGKTPDWARVTRYPRPDVAAAIPAVGDCSRAGYEIRIPPPAEAGTVRLIVLFKTQDGRVRHYPEVVFDWRP